MSGTQTHDWWWTTNHLTIATCASEHGLVPAADEDTLALKPEPNASHGERLRWSAFFEQFEDRDLALLHRETESSREDRWALVERTSITERFGDTDPGDRRRRSTPSNAP